MGGVGCSCSYVVRVFSTIDCEMRPIGRCPLCQAKCHGPFEGPDCGIVDERATTDDESSRRHTSRMRAPYQDFVAVVALTAAGLRRSAVQVLRAQDFARGGIAAPTSPPVDRLPANHPFLLGRRPLRLVP